MSFDFQDPENFGIGDSFDIPEIKEENPDNKEKKEDPKDEKEPETDDEKSETIGLKIGETEKELDKTEDESKGDAQNVAAISSPATEELTGEPLLRDLDSAAIQPENTNVTFAPDNANCLATAFPNPLLLPPTSAFLFLSFTSIFTYNLHELVKKHPLTYNQIKPLPRVARLME
mgnify:CR=1 FL=1